MRLALSPCKQTQTRINKSITVGPLTAFKFWESMLLQITVAINLVLPQTFTADNPPNYNGVRLTFTLNFNDGCRDNLVSYFRP